MTNPGIIPEGKSLSISYYGNRILTTVLVNTPNVNKRRIRTEIARRYHQRHPDAVQRAREVSVRYHKEHTEQIKAYQKLWRDKLNPNYRREYNKNYQRDMEKKRTYDKQYREIHREKNKQYYTEYYIKNPERARGGILKKYGISYSDYMWMYGLQNGKCLICNTQELVLCVDHDHKTGEIRGLLCKKCNRGLGCFTDDPHLIQVALDYLNG